MEPNPIIASVQQATQKAADAAIRERAAQDKKKPPAASEQVPPSNGTPPLPPETGDDNFSLASHIKTKYGIDISEEDLVSRLQQPGSNGNTPQSSVKKRVQPTPQDISDDEVAGWFEQQKKPNIVAQFKANASKEDIALVKETHIAQLKEQFKDEIDDDYAEQLFHERYYIPVNGEDDPYTDQEKAYGKNLLEQEAKRLRNATAFQVDGVRDLLYNERAQAYAEEEFAETVDAFLKDQPKDLTLPLGRSGAIDLGDYPINLEANTLATVTDILRTPVKLLSKFTSEKGDGLDLQKMYSYLLKAELFDDAIKSVAVDYYSKGVDSLKGSLHNYPDLDKNRPPIQKNTKKDEQDQAKEYNSKQVAENIGRGRKK